MSQDNEAVVRRYFDELCNGRNGDVADEIIATKYVSHGPQAPPVEGPDGVRSRVGAYQRALDGHWQVEELISAGDRVVARWIGTGTHRDSLMGIAATGKRIALEAVSIFRLERGQIAEEWLVCDALGLMRQLGAMP